MKHEDFATTWILQTDDYSLKLCELLHMMIRKVIEKRKYSKLDLPTAPHNDTLGFWWAFFDSKDGLFFELMMKNYLFKIKVHHFKESNSGFEAGNIVNLILKNLNIRGLEFFKKRIIGISNAFFQLLCKIIVYSYAWNTRKGLNVYIQSQKVENPLGSARLLLVETLYLIIKNDETNNYQIIEQIPLPCWNVLFIWLFEYKVNNMFQNCMVKIFEFLFFYNDQKVIMSILFKLNVLPKIRDGLSEIYQNKVILRTIFAEEVFFCMKRIVLLLNEAIQKRENIDLLKHQINANVSWKELKKLIVDTQVPTSAMGILRIKTLTSIHKDSLKSEKEPQDSTKRNSLLDAQLGSSEKKKQNLLLPVITSPKSSQMSVKNPGALKSPKNTKDKPIISLPK